MSVLVTSLLVGCGALVGRFLARGSSTPKAERHDAPVVDAKDEETKKQVERAPSFDAFPCRLGDVVLRSTGDEAWLAGAIVLSEGGDASVVLFVSPEAGADRAVLARGGATELLWLSEEKDVTIAQGEPPTALEAGGDRFERKRRIPFHAERLGTGAPDLGRDVIFAEYTGLADECLVVLATKGRVIAFRGVTLTAGSYDVLPGKDS